MRSFLARAATVISASILFLALASSTGAPASDFPEYFFQFDIADNEITSAGFCEKNTAHFSWRLYRHPQYDVPVRYDTGMFFEFDPGDGTYILIGEVSYRGGTRGNAFWYVKSDGVLGLRRMTTPELLAFLAVLEHEENKISG